MHLEYADRIRWSLALVAVLVFCAWSLTVEAGGRRDAERVALAQKVALKGAESREVDVDEALLLGAAAVRLHAGPQTLEALADTLANDGSVDFTDVRRSDDVAIASDGSFVLALPGEGA